MQAVRISPHAIAMNRMPTSAATVRPAIAARSRVRSCHVRWTANAGRVAWERGPIVIRSACRCHILDRTAVRSNREGFTLARMSELLDRYRAVRARTLALAAPLSVED